MSAYAVPWVATVNEDTVLVKSLVAIYNGASSTVPEQQLTKSKETLRINSVTSAYIKDTDPLRCPRRLSK